MDSLINIGIYITYVLLIAAIAGAILFPVIQTFGDLKKAKGSLIGIGAAVALFLISYAISSPETGAFYDKFNISPAFSKVIGAGLIATYIITIAVLLSILYSQVAKWIK